MGENSWNGYEHNCLFANRGGGRFLDVARPTGADGTRDGRGVAVVDLDGDGRLDLVINNNHAPPTVYLNRVAGAGNWLALDLVGTASNRDAVGARVRLTAGGRTLTRQVEAGSGYASQSARVLHFGLGRAERVEAVEIAWPSGRLERLAGPEAEGLGINRTVVVEEGARPAARLAGRPAGRAANLAGQPSGG